MYTRFALAVGLCLAVGAAATASSVFDTNGFEGYAAGQIAGQSLRGNAVDPAGSPRWIDDSGDRDVSQPPAVADIISNAFTQQSGHNNVLSIDPASLSTYDYAGAYLPFDLDLVALGGSTVTIEFDQYRGTTNQTAFVVEAPGPRGDSAWAAYEYGLNGVFHPSGRVSGSGVPMTAGAWQHVQINLDFDAQTVSALVDGVAPGVNPQTFSLGNEGVKAFRGIGFRVYGTDRGTPNGPNYFDNVRVTGGGGAIPEPSSVALLAAGLIPLARRRRR